MWTGIWGFLSALPKIVEMIQNFSTWINKVSGNDPAGFIEKSALAFEQLAKANTQEEHANAAKNLSDLIRSLPLK
jgi:hypothetical protein